MKTYVGAKIIQAEPMTDHEFKRTFKPGLSGSLSGVVLQGYHVVYPPAPGSEDPSYDSWSPAAVFENAYREVTLGEKNLILFPE